MGKRSVAPAATIAAVAVVLVGAQSGSALADAAAGKDLAGHWCAECHALYAGEQPPDPNAPSFPELAKDPVMTGYSLRLLLRSPHPTMPHIVFTDEQLDDIIDFILSLKPRG